MPTYIASGVKARFMLFSDFGVLNYGTAVMTQPKRLAEEPELCAAFVDGHCKASRRRCSILPRQ